MAIALRHRGPDDCGQWLDHTVGIGLGHRRLAVIDLTAAGHQPMESESGRFFLVFNGEIYNHLELRPELAKTGWRGHSDTETLLAAIEEWGLERTLQQAVGMFALVLWDRERRILSLARDRMGEKPLYYGWQGKSFVFASELKALQAHPDFEGEIDRSALASYVRRGYVPAPRSILAGINKLIPGTIVEIRQTDRIGDVPQPRAYWSLGKVITGTVLQRFEGSPEEAVSALEKLLTSVIRQQRISDVPLGAFLSGGTDSSTVVALMQATSSMPVKTFTIGFDEQTYDEAQYARAVAKHLKTDHAELYVSGKDALEVIPDLPRIYDEPFADMSQIPTVLVSRLARQYVTVALSGDGGDELFCGYGHYDQAVNSWRRLSAIPLIVRSTLHRVLPDSAVREGIAAKDVDDVYQFITTQWKGFPNIVTSGDDQTASERVPDALGDAKERLMYLDALRYLPDDILVKVDRAAMSTSLETRMPLLDHRVVEFAWRLPIELKCRNGIGKWPLKQILHRYVPEPIVERPKRGFGVPMEHWLRGPLRGWAEELLAEDRIRHDGFFALNPIRQQWRLHLSGKQNRQYGLWTILMFQSWLDHLRRTTLNGSLLSSLVP